MGDGNEVERHPHQVNAGEELKAKSAGEEEARRRTPTLFQVGEDGDAPVKHRVSAVAAPRAHRARCSGGCISWILNLMESERFSVALEISRKIGRVEVFG